MKLLQFILVVFFAVIFIIGCSSDTDNFGVDQGESIQTKQQWRNGEWWTPCEAASLVLFVDPCFLDPARIDAFQAITDAIEEFNNAIDVGIDIRLVFDINNPDIDITIQCDDLKIDNNGANGCVNQTGGDLITIDTNGPGSANCPVNICYHTNTIMHELGHILGFGHTNIAGDGETIQGTVVNTNSVFVTGDCNSTICALSPGDLLALQTQYPCNCPPAFEGDKYYCLGETAIFCITQDYDINVSWESPIVSDSNCIEFSPKNSGTYNILAMVDDNGCAYEVSELVQFHSQNQVCAINPPLAWSQICLGDLTATCYDFSDWECFESVDVLSSDSKLITTINDKEICLSYIGFQEKSIVLTMRFLDACGNVTIREWIINIVDCENNNEDNYNSRPSSPNCNDPQNPCPCTSANDCPPGWICAENADEGICVEL